MPHTQAPTAGLGLVVRLDGMNPAQVLPALRQRIAAIDSALPLVRRHTDDRHHRRVHRGDAAVVGLTSVFALVAALLASLGIYSLIAYSVAQRSPARSVSASRWVPTDRPWFAWWWVRG